ADASAGNARLQPGSDSPSFSTPSCFDPGAPGKSQAGAWRSRMRLGPAVPQRVWGATLFSALARQWSALCTLLTLAVLARALTSEDFGRFTFYLAWLSFLDVFVDCGTSTVAVQRG